MPHIDPNEWRAVARRRCPPARGLSDWYPGTERPGCVGRYERFFTDSMIVPPSVSVQYWDGEHWLTDQGQPHWRQVGDYPAWRGLSRKLITGQEIVLVRGARGRVAGIGCERRVRARLISASPYEVHAVLLEDDALAGASPKKAGEAGVWHGLSFIE